MESFPLHCLVWKNEPTALSTALNENPQHLNKLDNRGRSPLMLAVTMEHLECAAILLDAGADVNMENDEGWTVVQEAVATGNYKLVQMIIQKRDLQRHTTRMMGIPSLLHKLKEAPDFYIEMKWEFSSWVPLVSRMCPSDTYKVYKQGSNVRIDTTLLGFDQSSWQRGNKSYLFKAESEEKAVMVEVDHDAKQAFVEEMKTVAGTVDEAHQLMTPSDDAVASRLSSPIVHTYVDTEAISFERNKSGVWGWRSDKTETINGRQCKVFGANNVQLVTKTRTEHLSAQDKNRLGGQNQRFPLNTLLTVAQTQEVAEGGEPAVPNDEQKTSDKPVTLEEYFDPKVDLIAAKRHFGRPREMSTKIQKFKATLWLCEDFPLGLADQIMPIVDLMAISSTHFAKLRDFIQMQLPAGFPVKIEIPLFHVMNACITFGNAFALDEPVDGITYLTEEGRGLSCAVDPSCFETPAGYTVYGMGRGGGRSFAGGNGSDRRQFSMDEEDELLQYAIQQSLVDAGSEGDEVDIWEALKAQRPSQPSTPQPSRANQRPSSSLGFHLSPEDEQLQRAIEASLLLLATSSSSSSDPSRGRSGIDNDDGPSIVGAVPEDEAALLAEALQLSAQETVLAEERRSKEDDELMLRIIELSLLEK